MDRLPVHIAVIMDGNGRWAKNRNLPRFEGHRVGRERIRDIVRACGELGIAYLTLYAFSSENWERPREEVEFLMKLLDAALDEEFGELLENNVRFRAIGTLRDLPAEIQAKIRRNMERTRDHTGLTVTLALSYSAREEIIEAVKDLIQDVQRGKLAPQHINAELFSRYLYTEGLPDPDLLIRTSGEMRVSNFLLWQISYTEIYVTDKLWPDFHKQDLLEALENYAKRERRFGKTEPIR